MEGGMEEAAAAGEARPRWWALAEPWAEERRLERLWANKAKGQPVDDSIRAAFLPLPQWVVFFLTILCYYPTKIPKFKAAEKAILALPQATWAFLSAFLRPQQAIGAVQIVGSAFPGAWELAQSADRPRWVVRQCLWQWLYRKWIWGPALSLSYLKYKEREAWKQQILKDTAMGCRNGNNLWHLVVLAIYTCQITYHYTLYSNYYTLYSICSNKSENLYVPETFKKLKKWKF